MSSPVQATGKAQAKEFLKKESHGWDLQRLIKDKAEGLLIATHVVKKVKTGGKSLEVLKGEAQNTAGILKGEIAALTEAKGKAEKLTELVDHFLKAKGTIAWVGLTPVLAYKSALKHLPERAGECIEVQKELLAQLPKGDDPVAYAVFNDQGKTAAKKSVKVRHELSHAQEECFRAFAKAMHEKAIRTYLQRAASKGEKRITLVSTILTEISAVGQLFIPPTWKWTGATADLLVKAGERVAKEALLSVESDQYKEKHIAGSIYREHNADPLTFAKGIYEDHKQNLQLVLKTLGIGLAEMPWWPFVSSALETVIDKVFERKLDEAKFQKAIAQGEVPEVESLQQTVWETVKEQLLDVVKSPANWLGAAGVGGEDGGGGQKGASGSWAEFAASAVFTTFMNTFITVVVKYLPIDPAEEFSGDEMLAELRSAAETVLGKAHRIIDVAFPERDLPTEDAGGRPVESVLSGLLEDGSKKFWWVSVGGKVGALYQDDLRFVGVDDGAPAPSSQGMRHFLDRKDLQPPTEAGWNNRFPVAEIDLAKSDLEYDFLYDFWVRIVLNGKSLWGWANANPDREFASFQPVHPDGSALSKWSTRFVEFNGYREGGVDGALVEGKWYAPYPMAKGVVLFLGKDGSHEWAHLIDHPLNTPGDDGDLASVLKIAKRPLPEYDMRDLL